MKFLQTMQKHGYVGEFEIVDDHRSGKIVVELTGRINKCGVISPRFDVPLKDIEAWVFTGCRRASSAASSSRRSASWTTRRRAQADGRQDPGLLLLRCCKNGGLPPVSRSEKRAMANYSGAKTELTAAVVVSSSR